MGVDDLKKMKRNKKSEVFSRFFVSYLIFLAIPFFIFFFLLYSMTEHIEENSVRESQYVLKSLRESMDYKMEDVYSSILSLNYGVTMRNLLNNSEKEKDIEQLLCAKKEISYMERGRDTIYVYLPEEEILLSSKGVYSRLEEIYGSVFSYGSMDYEEFKTNILMNKKEEVFFPSTRVKTNSNEHTSILYVRQIPFGLPNDKNARVLFFIDCKDIDNQIQTYLQKSKSKFGIYDEERKCLYPFGESLDKMDVFVKNLDEHDILDDSYLKKVYEVDDTLYTVAHSRFNGWLMVSSIEKAELFEQLYKVQKNIVLVFLIYVVVGCCVAFYIAKKNLRPLHKILALWNRDASITGPVNEYQILESYVQDIIIENQELINSNGDYQEKMRKIWLQNLITGKYDTDEEIQELELPVINQYQKFQVLLIDFSSSVITMEEQSVDQLTFQRHLIKKQMGELELKGAIITEIDICQMAVLFYSNEQEEIFESQIHDTCKDILSYLKKNNHENVRLGRGATVKGMLYIGYSFVQAKCAVRACMEYQKDYMAYSTFPRKNEKYYFPNQFRDMLVEGIQNGNLKRMKSILKILNVENFESRKLSRNQEKEFLEEIESLILHLKNKDLIIVDTQPPKELEGQDKYYYYVNLIMSACMKRTEESLSQKKTIQKELIQFIDENYKDSNLCLSMVAQHFNMSESYVSYLFKKTYQIKFSTYLENKRIEEAKILLFQKKGTVEEIGRMVGYNSSHVFRRAFHKVTGQNPSEISKI